MIYNIFAPLINYIFYALSFIWPLSVRSYNSFNPIFDFDLHNLNFSSLMTNIWIVIIGGLMLYFNNKQQLKWQDEYLFKLNTKYTKFNRYFLAITLGCLIQIPLQIFNINLLEKWDYFTFLISFLLIVGFISLSNIIVNQNENTKKKIIIPSRFDTIVIFLILLFFSVTFNANPTIFIILYMMSASYSKKVISYVALLINVYLGLIFILSHLNYFLNFNLYSLLASIICPLIFLITYKIIFNTTKEQKNWISAFLFVLVILFYIFFI